MGGREGGERGSCDDNHLHLLLSEDVLIQFLLRLPVISLLRFKTVCKSWRSIIQSPFFIHLHATTSKLDSGSTSTSSFLFHRRDEHGKEWCRDHIFSTLSGDEFEVFEDLGKRPLVDSDEEFCIVGCCNGIICLHDFFNRNVSLWNPAIKQFRLLPKPSNLLGDPDCYGGSHGYCSKDFVIFGIDVKSKDYKVLLITTFQRYQTFSSVSESDDDENTYSRHARRFHVYNLSSDSWRCIDATLSTDHLDLDLKIHNNNVGKALSLNGNNFFMVYSATSKWWLILSFDFTEEIFRTIQPPDYWKIMDARISLGLIPLGEKIALIDTKQHSSESSFDCNIWVLNENENEQHGVKESWTKLYNVGNGHSYPHKLYIKLLCITNTGHFGIIYWEQYSCPDLPIVQKLRLLNLATGEQKDLQSDCQGWLKAHVAGVYKPSLVQIGRSGMCNK